MRIALDATYSVDPHPSGITVYSRQIMQGLPALHLHDQFCFCYRLKQWRQRAPSALPNVQDRLLQRPFSMGRPRLFHALNQRVDWRPAKTVVTTFHDLFVMTADYSTPEFRRRFKDQARRAVANSDGIIAVSEFTAGQVQDLLGVARCDIHVVPHGMHPRNTVSNLARERLVLFVGTLQRRKNIIRLVQAFAALPRDWKLVLAGSPTGYGSAEILKAIDCSASRDRIEVTGYVTDFELQRLYARAAIFAFPSLDEGFGIPVLDAMAQGVPVVTANRSALPEIAGDAALLVDPESVEDIARALRVLADDADLRDQLRERGKRRATQFLWSKSISATYDFYQQLTGTQ